MGKGTALDFSGIDPNFWMTAEERATAEADAAEKARRAALTPVERHAELYAPAVAPEQQAPTPLQSGGQSPQLPPSSVTSPFRLPMSSVPNRGQTEMSPALNAPSNTPYSFKLPSSGPSNKGLTEMSKALRAMGTAETSGESSDG